MNKRSLNCSELTSIQREITGLLALEYQMDRNLEELRSLRASSQYNKTVQGRVLQWAGRLFAIYCIFRTLSVCHYLFCVSKTSTKPFKPSLQCILNIIVPFRSASADPSSSEESNSSYPDLITHFLTYLVSLLPFVHMSAEDIAAIARQVSLGLVGIIILSSVRFVLRAVSRVGLSSNN